MKSVPFMLTITNHNPFLQMFYDNSLTKIWTSSLAWNRAFLHSKSSASVFLHPYSYICISNLYLASHLMCFEHLMQNHLQWFWPELSEVSRVDPTDLTGGKMGAAIFLSPLAWPGLAWLAVGSLRPALVLATRHNSLSTSCSMYLFTILLPVILYSLRKKKQDICYIKFYP